MTKEIVYKAMRKLGYVMLCAFAFIIIGCGNGAKKELNRMLVELADKDQTIDSKD